MSGAYALQVFPLAVHEKRRTVNNDREAWEFKPGKNVLDIEWGKGSLLREVKTRLAATGGAQYEMMLWEITEDATPET